MRKRFLVLLPILLLLLPFTLAFSDWIYPGETFTVDGELWSVTKGSSPYEVLLQQGSERYVLNYAECKVSQDGLEKYCYTKSDYVDCDRHDYDCPKNDDDPDEYWCCPYDVKHVHYEAGSPVFGAYLEFSELTPTATITRSVDETVLKLGESTAVKVTLKNTGEETINNGLYEEYIPEGLSVVTNPDWSKQGNKLSVKVSLTPGSTKTYRYTLLPKEYVTGGLKGNFSYEYEGVDLTVASSSTTINVPSPFIITHSFEPGSATINEPVTYTYELKNNDGEHEMEASFVLSGIKELMGANELPEELDVEEDHLTWEGTLEKGESIPLEFNFRPTKTGKYLVAANTSMTLNGELFEHKVQDTLTVSAKALTPEIRFSNDNPRAGSEVTLRLLIDNEDGDTIYHKIAARLTGELLEEDQRYALESVVTGEIPLVAEMVLPLPYAGEEKTYDFTFIGTYESITGEQFTFDKSASLKVAAHSAPFKVTQTINETSVNPGDTIQVVVKVKNQQAEYATISISDILPSGAVVKAGIRENELSLDEGEEREAYTYQVTVPESFDSETFFVTTRVFDQQADEYFDQQANVSVELAYVPPPVNETNEVNETPIPVTPPPAKEEKGFFRSVIDSIVDFFTGLF